MSQDPKKIRVSILNPLAGCQNTTSLAHARRYIRRGAAEWAQPDRVLRFVVGHRVQQHAKRSAVTRRGEGAGMASLRAVEGLPVAGPAIRLFWGKKPDTEVYDHSTVEHKRQLLPVESWL